MLLDALETDSNISIHPPRVGRDVLDSVDFTHFLDFNPPSPCGEGPAYCCIVPLASLFQSTLPVWGGTAKAHKNSL